MFRAYRYRLEYSGRRERGKCVNQICLCMAGIDRQPGNLIIFQKVHHIVVTAESSRMCCLPVVCCITLLFPLRFYYFLTRTG